ncbi:ATP-binding protein [Microbulbifer litoralis]|uniref:ATP-binding protein n=1 Tax=Microbulbifer litoralis TaxID=2933965 RepID=UPI002029383B|nr:ATP-binding protein [Microbulbifer sp. GX H0434]
MKHQRWRLTKWTGISGIIHSCLMMTLLMGMHTAQADNGLPPILLADTATRYPLVSLEHSPGFIPAPHGMTLEQAAEHIPRVSSASLKPDFRQHERYWLYTRVVNHTKNSNWVFHISNFGFQQPRVMIQGDHGRIVHTLKNTGFVDGTDVNPIGRATAINLQPGESFLLVAEVKASHNTWLPYMALMSAQEYDSWARWLSLTYNLAIGITLGFILLGLICWTITREAPFFWASLAALLMLLYYLEHSSIPVILWQWDYHIGPPFWMLASATCLGQLAFAASFLKIQRRDRFWFYFFIVAAATSVTILFLSPLLTLATTARVFAVNYLLISVCILGSGISRVRSEGSYYIIYLLGWFPMVLSLIQVLVVIHGPAQNTQVVTESHKMIHVLYIHIVHLFLHAAALILRLRSLREEKLKAEFMSLAKSQFIAHSSHDLSQPLNSMSIFLEHLQPHIHNQDGKKIFHRMKSTHRQMRDSFQAIMDLGKLESGAITPEYQAVSISDMFSRLQNEYQVLAKEKGIKIRFQLSSLSVSSDPVLLSRMLRNLISNAVKYTNEGSVLVGCRRRGSHVAIQVLDTGCGIDDTAREQIFDIYQRSGTNAATTPGAGIGLSIVRHIAELLEHPVTVASIPDRGSCFTVTLPRRGQAVASPEALEPSRQKPTVIALVIDDETLQARLSTRFRKWSCKVVSFRSLAAASESSEPLSLLLCEPRFLAQTSLCADTQAQLTGRLVCASVGDGMQPLPASWIRLPANPPAAQLRALLNTALRQQGATMNLSPDIPVSVPVS